MATRRYSLDPGQTLEQLTEAVGAATVTNHVELTVDLATNVITEGASTRQILKSEVIVILKMFMEQIVRSNWPPA